MIAIVKIGCILKMAIRCPTLVYKGTSLTVSIYLEDNKIVRKCFNVSSMNVYL